MPNIMNPTRRFVEAANREPVSADEADPWLEEEEAHLAHSDSAVLVRVIGYAMLVVFCVAAVVLLAYWEV